ncbi:MAG: 1-phosphofructokinase family hexose kinase [Roseobacter sp.]|jgi:6-phosphofructokinase 2
MRPEIQQGILTITLNPAVDLATSVERVVAGPKLYCRKPRIDPGGGGVNVARAIRKLNGSAKALVAVGGVSGHRLLDLLAAEAVPVHPVQIGGETRESFAVTDESDGTQYRFSLPGDTLGSETAELLISEIVSQSPRDGYVVLSGGVAPGLGDDYPECIRAALSSVTDRLIVDTSKRALEKLISDPVAPLFLLRLDKREAEQAAGHAIASLQEAAEFAQHMIGRGVAHHISISGAAAGSVLVTENRRYICRAPEVPVVSKIGAGDAFVGSLTLSLARGAGFDVALQWGVAAATATMSTEGTGLCALPDVEALLPLCEVQSF